MSRPHLRIVAIVLFVVAYAVEIAYATAPKHVAYPVAVGLHHYGIAALPSSWIVRACLLVQLVALALLVPFRALAAHASTTFKAKRSATVKAYMSGSESFGRRIHANEARLTDLEHRVAADVAARVQAALAVERRLLADAEAALAAERSHVADVITGWQNEIVAHRLERELGPAPVAPPALSVTAAAAIGESLRIAALQPVGAAAPPRRAPGGAAAAAIGESLRIAALQPVGAAAPPRRAPGADDSLTSIQGAPMSIISESAPELVTNDSAASSAEQLSIPPSFKAPLATLAAAILAVIKSKGAPAALTILATYNVKIEAFLADAAMKKSPVLGYLVQEFGGEIVSALGGEEAALLLSLELYLAADVAKLSA